MDWNQEYFTKLFHGLSLFELEGNPHDQDDDSQELVIRDHFDTTEETFLMRAKLVEEFGYDFTLDFWNVFQRYNN